MVLPGYYMTFQEIVNKIDSLYEQCPIYIKENKYW